MQQFLPVAGRGVRAAEQQPGGRGAGGDPGDEMRRLIASRSVDAFLLSELQPDDPRG
jgi:hypothetical protein